MRAAMRRLRMVVPEKSLVLAICEFANFAFKQNSTNRGDFALFFA